MAKTGNQLISDVQLTITMPNNQVLITDDRLLDFANDEMMSTVVPMIVSLNQEYFVRLDESQTTQNGVAEYDIPYRAIGRILRDLRIKDQNDNSWNCTQIYLEDANTLEYSSQSFAYYFKGDVFRAVPIPRDNSFTWQKYYLLRPNSIIKTGDAGFITNISGNIVTVSVVPETFAAGVYVDFIKGRQGNSTITMDQLITNVAGNQITITDVPSTLAIGDWVSVAETSPVMQLPDECFSYLSDLTALRCLSSISDYEGAAKISDTLPAKRRAIEQLLAPRNQGEAIKIINRRGLLRGNRNSLWRGVFR
jgi:hypothetical protein